MMKKRFLKLAFSIITVFLINISFNTKGEEGISFNFRDTDIKVIIESVAKITGKNILIDPRVRGNVTILSNETIPNNEIYDVLLMILSLFGYNASETEYATIIAPVQIVTTIGSDLNSSSEFGLVTEIISLKNVPVNTISQIIRPFLSQQARIQTLNEYNKLIITDSRANLTKLKKILVQVDVVTNSEFELIQLKNTSVNDIIQTVKTVFGRNTDSILKIEADRRNNRLLVVTKSIDIRLAIRALVAALDEPTSSGNQGDLLVIYLNYAQATKVAPIISGILSSNAYTVKPNKNDKSIVPLNSGQQNKFSIQADEDLNALVVAGDSGIIYTVRNLVQQLDLPRAQVAIEVIIAELSDRSINELGIDFVSAGKAGAIVTNLSGNLNLAGIGQAINDNNTFNYSRLLGAIQGGEGSTSGFMGGLSSNSLWAGLIRAIDNDSTSQLLSTPFITSIDNSEASLTVGEERPFVTGTYTNNGNNTTNPFQTIQRKNVGIDLKFKPQISSGNSIRLEVEQDISSVNQGAESSADNVVTSVRKIKTTVFANSGDIIAMGGLRQKDNTKIVRRVPILGYIPILGRLFTYKRNTARYNNLIVFIKPTIVVTSNELKDLSSIKYNNFKVDSEKYKDIITEDIKQILDSHFASKTNIKVKPDNNNQKDSNLKKEDSDNKKSNIKVIEIDNETKQNNLKEKVE